MVYCAYFVFRDGYVTYEYLFLKEGQIFMYDLFNYIALCVPLTFGQYDRFSR